MSKPKVKSQKSKAKLTRSGSGEIIELKDVKIKKQKKQKALFYIITSPCSDMITVCGLGTEDGSISLTKEHWKLLMSDLLCQI